MPLDNFDEYVNRATGGSSGNPQQMIGFKADRVAGAAPAAHIAGRISSLWLYGGSNGPGAAPGAVRIPTNATNGAMKQADASGGRTLYKTSMAVSSSQPGTLLWMDRLLDISGLNATTLTAQTVGGTITRNTGGVGNEIYVEIYTQIGASSTTITASYTNQAGTAGRTTEAVAFGNTGFREAQRMIRLPLQAGDTGVQSVQSVTVLATTGTAGDFGVTLCKPYAIFDTGYLGSVDIDSRLQAIEAGACMFFAFLPTGTTAPIITYDAAFMEVD